MSVLNVGQLIKKRCFYVKYLKSIFEFARIRDINILMFFGVVKRLKVTKIVTVTKVG